MSAVCPRLAVECCEHFRFGEIMTIAINQFCISNLSTISQGYFAWSLLRTRHASVRVRSIQLVVICELRLASHLLLGGSPGPELCRSVLVIAARCSNGLGSGFRVNEDEAACPDAVSYQFFPKLLIFIRGSPVHAKMQCTDISMQSRQVILEYHLANCLLIACFCLIYLRTFPFHGISVLKRKPLI